MKYDISRVDGSLIEETPSVPKPQGTVACIGCKTTIAKPPAGLHVCEKCAGAAEEISIQSQEIIDLKYGTRITSHPAPIFQCGACKENVNELIDNMCNVCKSKSDEADEIQYPKHYNAGNIQPIDAIEDWNLDFRLANAVKYIARHEHKGSAKKDLEKAIWYIERYIAKELTKEGK